MGINARHTLARARKERATHTSQPNNQPSQTNTHTKCIDNQHQSTSWFSLRCFVLLQLPCWLAKPLARPLLPTAALKVNRYPISSVILLRLLQEAGLSLKPT